MTNYSWEGTSSIKDQARQKPVIIGSLELFIQEYSRFGDPLIQPITGKDDLLAISDPSSDSSSDTIDVMDALKSIFTQVHESALVHLPKEIGERTEFFTFLGDAKQVVVEKFGQDVCTEFEVDDGELDDGALVFRFGIQLNEDIQSAMAKLHQLDEWRSQQSSASSDLIYFDLDV